MATIDGMRFALLAVLLAGCTDDPHETKTCDIKWGSVLGMPIPECDAACATHPEFSTNACAFTDDGGVQRSCAAGPQAKFGDETGCCVITSIERVRWFPCE